MLRREEKEELLERYEQEAKTDPIALGYPCYVQHLDNIYERREAWAICMRKNLPIRGNNTNNFVEAAMRVLKDNVFYRVRAFNVIQLQDFILTILS